MNSGGGREETGERDRRERVVKGTRDLNEGTKKTGKEKKEDRKDGRLRNGKESKEEKKREGRKG